MALDGKVVVREWSVPVAGLSTGSTVRIAHISDLHFTRWNRTYADAQRTLAELDYDLLAVTGDFCDFRFRWQRAVGFCRRFFEPLASGLPILAVLGNHDHPSLAETPDLPFRFLGNESTALTIAGQTLRVAGVDQALPGRENLDAALSVSAANTAGAGPTILLAHYPSTVYRLCDRNRADLQQANTPRHEATKPRSHEGPQLVLSGHTHGGQIRFPRIGCLWPNDRIPRRFACGLHRVSDLFLHVSAGIGVSLPVRMRINCPPEIGILTLIAT